MNFEVIKIYSSLLNEEVEAQAFRDEDRLIISHDWLVTFAAEYGLVFEPVTEVISEDLRGCYISGKMYASPDSGAVNAKVVWGRGSASPSTVNMTPEVPSSFFLPEIAWNRCEDDCIMKYFGFPRRCYSDEMMKITAILIEKGQQGAKKIFDSSVPFSSGGTPFGGDVCVPFTDGSAEMPTFDDMPNSGVEHSPTENKNASAQSQPNYDDMLCTVGRNRDKLFKDISNDDLKWFVNSFTPRNEEGKKHVAAAKAVLAQRGLQV